MKFKYLGLVALLFVVGIWALNMGRFEVGFVELWQILTLNSADEIKNAVVFDIRLPRIVAAFFVGASLSVSGVAFQSMFSNPLVGPNILGVASGAGFGAALSILLFDSLIFVNIFAFIFGLAAVLIAYGIANMSNKNSNLMLVLAGIIVGACFSAFISFIKYVADPEEKLPTIVYWLMGSLSSASWEDNLFLVSIASFGMLILFMLRWKINILSLGQEQSQYLGERVKLLSFLVIVAATLVTSTSVAVAGIVGWVGLLIPHMARMIFGADNLKLVPSSILIGGIYLIVVDTIARSLTAAEIPLSILTSLIGAPLIGILIVRKGRIWF